MVRAEAWQRCCCQSNVLRFSLPFPLYYSCRNFSNNLRKVHTSLCKNQTALNGRDAHKNTHTQEYSSPTHSPPLHTCTHITQSCNQFSTCRLQWQLLYLLSAALQFSIKMFAQKTPFETAVPRAGGVGVVESLKRPSPRAFAYSENEKYRDKRERHSQSTFWQAQSPTISRKYFQ